jgi:methionine-rich copper-binding protein CopC
MFLFAFVLLAPAAVLGHAELDTVLPADKSTVEGPPVQVQMTFTEALDPAKSSIKLVDASGAVIAEGSTVDAGLPTTMRLVLLTDLAPGTYTARWASASAEDGDLDRGTTTFTVTAAASVAPSVAPSSPPASASAGPSAAAPSTALSAAPSAPPTTPASSTGDAVIPIVAALVVLVALGLWLLRGRSRAAR